MNNEKILTESLSDEIKENIIEYLIDEGYGTYARRLRAYKFIVADRYHGSYIDVAAMFPTSAEIVVNPNMVDISKMSVAGDIREDNEKLLAQLSVLLRHELLHFMLVHTKRFEDHLHNIDPKWDNFFKDMTAEKWNNIPISDRQEWNMMQEISNYAMDYDISVQGYDDHDKEVVRLMTLNNRVVGGLILEDDHPEWLGKTMEELYDLLKAEYKKEIEKIKNMPQTVVNVTEETHSQEYADMYNKIVKIFDDQKYSDLDLEDVLTLANAGNDILDKAGNIIVAKGEY